MIRICKVEGCNNKHRSKGYCNKHYKKYLKYGDPLGEAMYITGCKVEECKGSHASKGYCSKHYQRYLKYGDPLVVKYELHGMKNHPVYDIWQRMLRRCDNEAFHAYHRYGGRGIKVCDRWLHSFKNFYKDMGDRPFPKAQLDRIDNDGDYEPNNCRWVTAATNSRGRSTTKLTIEKARKIRSLRKSGYTYASLGILFNVSAENISAVVKEKTWREI